MCLKIPFPELHTNRCDDAKKKVLFASITAFCGVGLKLQKLNFVLDFPSVGHSYVRYQDQADFINCMHLIVSHDTQSNHETQKAHSLQVRKRQFQGSFGFLLL